MKKVVSSIFCILFFLLLSCNSSNGNRVDYENLKVFYLKGISAKKAVQFAKYWKKRGYVKEKGKQAIQLDKEAGTVKIKLIENKIYRGENLSISEEALLQQLERSLRKDVFHCEVRIVITDDTFTPILKRL